MPLARAELLELFAQYQDGDIDRGEFLTELEASIGAGEVPNDLIVLCVDTDLYYLGEDCEKCDKLDEWSSTCGVVVNRKKQGDRYVNTEETWCDKAKEDHAFFCEHNEQWYAMPAFDWIDCDGMRTCWEDTEPLYYWNSDSQYHLDPEGQDMPRLPGGVRQDGNALPGYHQTRRAWNDGDDTGNDLMFGCELEIKCTRPEGEKSQYKPRNDMVVMAKKHSLIGEKDGSLDEILGIEIVGNPETLGQHQDKEGTWLKFLHACKGKALGYDAGIGYGMHVNINRTALKRHHQARLFMFIHNAESLCERVSQRYMSQIKDLHRPGYGYSDFLPILLGRQERDDRYYSMPEQDRILDYTDAIELAGEDAPHGGMEEKKIACAFRSRKRIEIRIFRSTIKPESFLKNVEFAAAAVEFTRNTGVPQLTGEDFIQWFKVEGQPKRSGGKYNNLYGFLFVKKARKVTA